MMEGMEGYSHNFENQEIDNSPREIVGITLHTLHSI